MFAAGDVRVTYLALAFFGIEDLDRGIGVSFTLGQGHQAADTTVVRAYRMIGDAEGHHEVSDLAGVASTPAGVDCDET